jgi:hypothetical protein
MRTEFFDIQARVPYHSVSGRIAAREGPTGDLAGCLSDLVEVHGIRLRITPPKMPRSCMPAGAL